MTASGDWACPLEGGGQAQSRAGRVVPPMRHAAEQERLYRRPAATKAGLVTRLLSKYPRLTPD